MKTVTAKLKSISPMGQSKAFSSKKETGESHDHFEDRCWRERMHVDDNGEISIPPMAIKNCLSDCAKFLSETVAGKGKATYTKHFEAGVMVVEPGKLNIKAKDIQPLRLHVPSDGRKGGTTRVWKNFPCIPKWECEIEIILLDPLLIGNTDKVKEYLEHAGKFIGIGFFRPRRGGYWGRFEVIEFKVSK